MAEVIKYFSILVFTASIIYIFVRFSGESKLTEIFKNFIRNTRENRLKKAKADNGDINKESDNGDEYETGSYQAELANNTTPEKAVQESIFKKIIEAYKYFKKYIDDNLSKNTKLFLKIALIVISTRILIYLFGYYAVMLDKGQSLSLESIWLRWDAQHYLRIAKDWYIGGARETEIFIVFYPLYPIVVRVLSMLTGTVFSSAIILSNLFLVIGCFYMYKLFSFEYDEKTAANGMKYLLFFPVSFFLCAPFTESLFIMLSVMMFYYLRKEKWFLSAVIGMLAGLTRFHGILLLIPFLIEFFVQNDVIKNLYEKKVKIVLNDILKKGIFAFIIPMGFGLYLLLNKVVTGDWFKFSYWQDIHWSQGFKIFFNGSIPGIMDNIIGSKSSPDIASLWMPQIIIILVAFFAILYGIKMKMRISYFAYMAVYIFSTISLTWLLSAPRYIMAAFPIYIVAAKFAKTKKTDMILTFASLLFLMYCIFAYVNGRQIM